MSFALDPRLEADTLLLGDYPLCRVLLMNNRHFPWLILVPRLPEAVELTELNEADYTAVTAEIRQAAQAVQQLFRPYKLNIATLGNQVRQLHLHLIARFQGDAAWPNPVWGTPGQPYSVEAAAEITAKLRMALHFG